MRISVTQEPENLKFPQVFSLVKCHFLAFPERHCVCVFIRRMGAEWACAGDGWPAAAFSHIN